MKNFKFIIVGMSLILNGCATETFRSDQPVKTSGSFLSRSLTQDGKVISAEDAFSNFKQNKETKDTASTGELWYYGSLVLAASGGYLVGYNLFSKSDSKSEGLLAGVGLIGVGMVAAHYADQYLMESVEIHNQRFGKKKLTNYFIRPALGIVKNYNGPTNSTFIPTAGFLISY